ncbi:B12-binding domain-containing radical SAM protein [Geobacter sp. 60473]|uniref:B12-binding domain-containing radical SAM protein n=1 Tax=Geobacter sp. 60473 TaxID=3080755 RepID=UPI002B3152FB|nr:B12-binding domain-containing radical SAM protein [Geobacter sp. 60473]
MKVVLVAIHPYPSPQAVPLANACLAAYLATDEELSARVRVALCDFFTGTDAGACVDDILANAPDAVGFSLYLWNRDDARAMADELRRRAPGLTLFAGGPEATADPAGLLTGSSFDFLIRGEGEIPFLDVVGRLEAGEPGRGAVGTAWLDNGMLRHTPARPIRLIDTAPSPLLTGIIYPSGFPGVLWQLARGCDFSCEYCFDDKGEHGVRRYSLERIDAELDVIVRSGVSQVFVLDSTFNQDRERAKKVLKMIRARAPHIHFHFEVRSEFIDREMARLFAGITCSLQIGLQSADPKILRKIRRHLDPDDFRERISLLNESGAIFGFDLIYGLPGDSLAAFRRSLDFALELYPNHLDIFPLAILPGTVLANRAPAEGLEHRAAPPYTLTASPSFPSPDLDRAARLAEACDIFYTRGKSVAWFNSVASALRLSPAALLDEFADWLDDARQKGARGTDLGDQDIWLMQREFLDRIFRRRKRTALLPLALDLVDYHYYFAAALLAPPPPLPTDRELAGRDLLGAVFSLAPTARLARFSYEIVDILEAGEVDLASFRDCFAPSGSWAVIYPRGGDVYTEPLLESYAKFLQGLDGTGRAGAAASRAGLNRAEAREFLDFAAAEGIVVLAAQAQ